MRLRELANYASQHHHIGEEVKYADNSCYSVLRSPESGRWIAFFINQWDSASGEERECCDLKCGREVLQEYSFPWSFIMLYEEIKVFESVPW